MLDGVWIENEYPILEQVSKEFNSAAFLFHPFRKANLMGLEDRSKPARQLQGISFRLNDLCWFVRG